MVLAVLSKEADSVTGGTIRVVVVVATSVAGQAAHTAVAPVQAEAEDLASLVG